MVKPVEEAQQSTAANAGAGGMISAAQAGALGLTNAANYIGQGNTAAANANAALLSGIGGTTSNALNNLSTNYLLYNAMNGGFGGMAGIPGSINVTPSPFYGTGTDIASSGY